EAEGVAVRVVADLEDPGDHDAGDPLPRVLDRLDLGALAGQQLGEALAGPSGRPQLAEPGKDDLHAAPSNRSRKRTSPSTNSRMSLTPYLTIATRSIPMPNATPVYRSESIPQFSSTFGWTIPAPRSSSHPFPQT